MVKNISIVSPSVVVQQKQAIYLCIYFQRLRRKTVAEVFADSKH